MKAESDGFFIDLGMSTVASFTDLGTSTVDAPHPSSVAPSY